MRRRCSCSPMAVTTSWSAAPAAATAVGATWPSRAGARNHVATTGACSAICATSPAANSGPRRYQPMLKQPEALTRRSSRMRAPSSAARDRDFDAHTEIVRVARGRYRAAPHHAHQPRPQPAHDRDDQLRRGGAGARHRRCRCTRPSAICSCRPNSYRELQAILCTRRPRSSGEHAAWMCHLLARARRGDRRDLVRDRPGPLHRPRIAALAIRRRCDAMPAPLSNSRGLGAGSRSWRIRRTHHARAGAIGHGRILCHSASARTATPCLQPGREISDRASGRPRLRTGLDPQPGDAAPAQRHRGRGAALRAARQRRIIYAQPAAARRSQRPLANRRGQSGLWGHAISGDLPIVLLHARDRSEYRTGAPAGAGARVLALKGLAVDLVIWNEDHAGYRQQLQDQIMGLIASGAEASLLDRPGGIFVRSARADFQRGSHPAAGGRAARAGR